MNEENLLSEKEKKQLGRMQFLGATIRKYMNTEPALELKDLALVISEECEEQIIELLKELVKLKTKE